MFLGWIPEENYTWHMTFFLVGLKAKKKMMPSSRGNNLLESQQKAEKIVQVKGTASSLGWQESVELGGSEEAASGRK